MKVAYIAHPIGNDVQGNLDKIKKISRKINIEEKLTVPFAPYYLDCIALDDSNPTERDRGIKNNKHLLESGLVDELRLYGDRISKGMLEEINIALIFQIDIIPMTKNTKEEYDRIYKLISFK